MNFYKVPFNPEKKFAQNLDKKDPLRSFQKNFYYPEDKEKKLTYFCGNSLGLQPVTTNHNLNNELNAWKKKGVEAHFKEPMPWSGFHNSILPFIAKLTGCYKEEVVIMNSLTVNLHLLMVSFYNPTPERNRILMESKAFPSDIFAVRSQIRLKGYNPEKSLLFVNPEQDFFISTDSILKILEEKGNQIALVLFGGVNYYTGQLFDIEKITKAAHEKGCMVGWDLAHAIGNVPLKLHSWDVDFAVWCSYKYLNAGPGAVGGAFINQRFLDSPISQRLEGWWGNNLKSRFNMSEDFEPPQTAEAWQLSNEPILSMASLMASLKIFKEAGITNLFRKSRHLTSYLAYLINYHLKNKVEIITPLNENEHGAQLSLVIKSKKGKKVHAELRKRGFITDWREPSVLRVSPVPLYNGYMDVWNFVEAMVATN